MPNKTKQTKAASEPESSHIGTDLPVQIGKDNRTLTQRARESNMSTTDTGATNAARKLEIPLTAVAKTASQIFEMSKKIRGLESRLEMSQFYLQRETKENDELRAKLADLQSEFIGKQMEVDDVRSEEKVHFSLAIAQALVRLHQYEGDFSPVKTAAAILRDAFVETNPDVSHSTEGLQHFINAYTPTSELGKMKPFQITEDATYTVYGENPKAALAKFLSEVRCSDEIASVDIHERSVTDQQGNDVTAEAEEGGE